MSEWRVSGFVWLDEIIEKLIVKHAVHPAEVEEVFQDKPRFRFVEKGRKKGEDVYVALGQTDAGRYLVVFFIRKAAGRVLPISARDMTPTERKQYGRR